MLAVKNIKNRNTYFSLTLTSNCIWWLNDLAFTVGNLLQNRQCVVKSEEARGGLDVFGMEKFVKFFMENVRKPKNICEDRRDSNRVPLNTSWSPTL
jgi:hypothetical protein